MRTKYLLPCECGENIAISTSQAGQEVTCSCGAVVQVPTMKGIRELEMMTVDEPDMRPAKWDAKAGVALVGLVLVVIGLAFCYHTRMTKRPIMMGIDHLTPIQTWEVWERDLKGGVQLPEYSQMPYQMMMKVYRQYMAVGIGIVALGCVLVVAWLIAAIVTRKTAGG